MVVVDLISVGMVGFVTDVVVVVVGVAVVGAGSVATCKKKEKIIF